MLAGVLLFAAALTFGPPSPLQQPEVRAVSTQTDVKLAAGDDGYLAVWQDHRGILAGRIGHDGKVIDAAGFIVGAGTQPQVAWTGRRYVVAWNTIDPRAVLFTFVERDGSRGALHQFADDFGPLLVGVAGTDDSVLLLLYNRAMLVDAAGNVTRTITPKFEGTQFTAVATDGEEFVLAGLQGSDVVVYHVAANGDAALTATQAEVPNTVALAYGNGRYALAWGAQWGGATPTVRLRAMTVSRAGVKLTEPRDAAVLPRPLSGPPLAPRRVTWRGADFVAAYKLGDQLSTVALSAETALAAEPQPLAVSNVGDIAGDGTGRVLAVWLDRTGQLAVGFVESGVVATDAFARAGTVISATQPFVLEAAGRLLVSWLEDGLVRARINGVTKTLPAPTEASVRPAAGDVIWFLERAPARVRRYTLDLQSIDDGVLLGNIDVASARMAAVGSTVAVLHGGGYYPLEIALIDGTSVSKLAIPSGGAGGGRSAIVWTGGEFVVVWAAAGATDDELRAVRISRSGSVLDATPIVLGRTPTLTGLRAAASNGRVSLLWRNPSLHGATFTPDAAGDIDFWDEPGATGDGYDIAARPDGFVAAWRLPGAATTYRAIDLDGTPGPVSGSFSDGEGSLLSLATVGTTSFLAYTRHESAPLLGSWERVLLRSTAPARLRAVR